MARTALAIRSVPVRRSSGVSSKKLANITKRLQAVGRRTRDMSAQTEEAMIAIGAPALLGFAQARGTKLPSVGGFDPYLVLGVAFAIGGPKLLGGKNGKRLGAAGVGMLSVAANRAATSGTFKVAGDEIAGDEIAGDDDDD